MDRGRPASAWFVTKDAVTSYRIKRKAEMRRDGKAMVDLVQPVEFIVDFENGERVRFTIKAGYRSDGGSIPKPAQLVIGPPIGGSYEAATYAHDALCESRLMTAWDAGLVFNLLMDDIEVAGWRRTMMWWAVRRFCQPLQDRYSAEKVAFANDHLAVANEVVAT